MKILYITTIGITMGFFKNLIKELLDEGHIVDIACNEIDSKVPECYREWGCKVNQISCSRSPLKIDNIKAIKEIEQLVKSGEYDIVHCHTPIAAMCTRLACMKQRKKGLRVIYTAHGFHFYKGAPILNWMLYYPIEKVCSYFTDTLITINKEDYELAKKKMKAKNIEYVPGVGIDVDKFKNTIVDRKAKREELGIPEDAFLLLSVGELNENKNHEVVIRAMGEIQNENIHYAIAGTGHLKEHLIEVAKSVGLEDRLHLLGYRNDVNELYKVADLFCFPSKREGLPVSLMEAMASGLPCVASNIRGNNDLIDYKDENIVDYQLTDHFDKVLKSFLNAKNGFKKISEYNIRRVLLYSNKAINKTIIRIYVDLFLGR